MDWSLLLLVDVEDGRDLISPRLRIGGREFAQGIVRLELVDERDAVRHTIRRRLRPGDLNTELRLPSFSPPEGTTLERIIRWPWDVSVKADGRERIRWRRYLRGPGDDPCGLNREAEILATPHDVLSKAEEEGWGPEAPWSPRDTDRLLRALVDEGMIEPAMARRFAAPGDVLGRTVERGLIDDGYVSEHDLLTLYSKVTGTEFVRLGEYGVDPEAVAAIPRTLGRDYGLVAIGSNRGLPTVAMSDPQLPETQEIISHHLRPHLQEFFYIVVTTRDDVLWAYDRFGRRPHAPTDAASEPERSGEAVS